MDLDIEQLKIIKKEKFSKIIQKKVREAAFEYLLDRKSTHSKMEGIQYSQDLKIQGYLQDSRLNPSLAKLLFKFRCRMIQVKINFKKTYGEFNCPICIKNGEFFEDSQEHLMSCKVILSDSNVLSNNITVKYQHIFSNNVEQMIDAIKLLKIALQIRNQKLN